MDPFKACISPNNLLIDCPKETMGTMEIMDYLAQKDRKVTKETRGTWDPEVSEAIKDIKEKKVILASHQSCR